MAYQSSYKAFIFEGYSFNAESFTAEFHYSFDGERHFTEKVVFSDVVRNLDQAKTRVLENALKLSFYLAGTSYYKAFPTQQVIFKKAAPDAKQAKFLNKVYTEGLSQFIFENNLDVASIAGFNGSEKTSQTNVEYQGSGILALQSGGKDSLLMTTLLEKNNTQYRAMYVSSTEGYPSLLNDLRSPVRVVQRIMDREALQAAATDGALNGHVPVTYILESYALIDAILHGENAVLVSIGAEGGEAHEYIGDLAVNHQWSKTWEAEQLLTRYVNEYISSDIHIGSPLRGFSELKIAQMFVEHCWQKFGHSFSSCNLANYQQGTDNTQLKWCGECPKCANSYLLFAPFVEPKELQSLFGGQDLFAKPSLTHTFKGLLGIDGIMKPFECVGEVDELRLAYHMARQKYPDIYKLKFEVPESAFEYLSKHPMQTWAAKVLQ